jgi:hypothetical protein
MNKNIHILGGGTFSHVRNHLSLAVPAFGKTAISLAYSFCHQDIDHTYTTKLHLTKMADTLSTMETNENVSVFVDNLIADPETKVIVFNVAMCDYDGIIGNVASDKHAERLQTRVDSSPTMRLLPSEKVISKIRKERKDIFLVAFKTTCGATEHEQYIAGLNLLKENSCNLVLANDNCTRRSEILCYY